MILCMALVFVGALFAGGSKEKIETVEDWERWAQPGAYRPARDDWQAIEEGTKEEGTAVIYSLSSRAFEFGRTF